MSLTLNQWSAEILGQRNIETKMSNGAKRHKQSRVKLDYLNHIVMKQNYPLILVGSGSSRLIIFGFLTLFPLCWPLPSSEFMQDVVPELRATYKYTHTLSCTCTHTYSLCQCPPPPVRTGVFVFAHIVTSHFWSPPASLPCRLVHLIISAWSVT